MHVDSRAVLILAMSAFGSGAFAKVPTPPPAEEATIAPIRAIVASPDRYANQQISVIGRFRGRSRDEHAAAILAPLNRSHWDFVLQAPDAAIWVSGLRPKGRDFDLNPLSGLDARVGRWLEVTGRVRVRTAPSATCSPSSHCTQVWIEASTIRSTAAPEGATPIVPRIVGPPPTVVFNDPLADETNVRPTTSVRLQFSEDMDADSFPERVRLSYVAVDGRLPSPFPAYKVAYDQGRRSLEIRFAAPLQRFQSVRVELLDGIAARDGQKLAPWAFVFTTGG